LPSNKDVLPQCPPQVGDADIQGGLLQGVLLHGTLAAGLADGVRAVAVALSPYLPETAPLILGALGQPVELGLERVAYGVTPPTDGIAAAAPLFPRVDQPTAAA